jgi:hypothetical protein
VREESSRSATPYTGGSTRQQRIEAAVESRNHGQHKHHIGLPGLVLYSNSTAFVKEDANEDKDKGCVDEKVGRQVGKHGLSQVARAMTPPGPGLECSVQIFSILQQP